MIDNICGKHYSGIILLNQLFSINIEQANVLADLADEAVLKVCDILGCIFLIP